MGFQATYLRASLYICAPFAQAKRVIPCGFSRNLALVMLFMCFFLVFLTSPVLRNNALLLLYIQFVRDSERLCTASIVLVMQVVHCCALFVSPCIFIFHYLAVLLYRKCELLRSLFVPLFSRGTFGSVLDQV